MSLIAKRGRIASGVWQDTELQSILQKSCPLRDVSDPHTVMTPKFDRSSHVVGQRRNHFKLLQILPGLIRYSASTTTSTIAAAKHKGTYSPNAFPVTRTIAYLIHQKMA